MVAWAWWLLAGSVLVALIIMVVSFILTRKKIVKIRNSYIAEMTEVEKENAAKGFERKNFGIILNEEKPKKDFTGDIEMEFAFNSFYRNGFKTARIVNATSDYERKSFEKLAEAKIVEKDYDFALVRANGKVYESIKEIYANLNKGGMIIVTEAPKRSKEIKTLKYDLKMLGYRNEWQDFGKGLVLIAK